MILKLFKRNYAPITYFYEVIAKKYLKRVSREYITNKPQIAMFGFDFITNEIVLNGRYEDSILNWILENLKQYTHDKASLDIGANIGNHTIAFSAISKEVIAFEPNPKTFQVLKINQSINKNIHIFNYGLSSQNQNMKAYVPKNNIGGASVKKNRNTKKITGLVEFKLRKLDDINDVCKKEIGLIKIDVEGNELKVLKGMKNLLGKQSPIILFEKNDLNSKSDEIDLLKNMSYGYFYEFKDESKWIFKNKFLRIIEGFLFGIPSKKKIICNLKDYSRKHELIIAAKFPLN